MGNSIEFRESQREQTTKAAKLPIRRPLVSCVLAYATGAPLGREGVYAYLSGLGATLFARFSRLSDEDRRVVYVAALAAFLALAVRAPLAAPVLAVELLYRRFEFKIEALASAVLSSVVAYAIPLLCAAVHSRTNSDPSNRTTTDLSPVGLAP